MKSNKRTRFPYSLFILIILLIFINSVLSEENDASLSSSTSTVSKVRDKPKTFIADLIGWSAFKILLILGIPTVFSIFLGAMLVLLFPFPLLTSTSGLAGAAAIGKRQGRESKTQEGEDLINLFKYLDFGSDYSNNNYLPTNEIVIPSTSKSYPGNEFYSIPQLINPQLNYSKVKKRKIKLKKFPVYQKPSYPPAPKEEECSERIACEIGRSAGSELKGVFNQLIQTLTLNEQLIWKSVINAYHQGSYVRLYTTENEEIPKQILPRPFHPNHLPHNQETLTNPVFNISSNNCLQFQCHL